VVSRAGRRSSDGSGDPAGLASAPVDETTHPTPPSDRVRLRRHAERGRYGHDDVAAVLDAGMVAHVGVVTADGPIVLPMAYGRDDEHLYLHGARANALLGAAGEAEVCVTVTLLDGLVIGRSAFHNSMNFRSVVVRGVARPVTDDDARRRALALVSDHVVATWDRARPVSDGELRRTEVVAVALAEASVKVRTGPPVDEPDDYAGPWWAGVVPVTTVLGAPEPDPALDPGVPVPEAVARLEDTTR
jgi:uncharacterized protein